jgi:hypothetical protein
MLAQRDGAWTFDIKDGIAAIPVKKKYQPITMPTPDDVRLLLARTKATEDKTKEKVTERRDWANKLFRIRNNSGNAFTLWLYDCYWCYNNHTTFDKSEFLDIRMEDTAKPEATFSAWDAFQGASGWFAFYLDYTASDGQRRRNCLGVHNIHETPVLIVSEPRITEDGGMSFDARFTN